MDSFLAHYIDCRDPLDDPRIAARLRQRGLVTFSGVTDRSELVAAARRLMVIRPHRDAGFDGVTVITAADAPSAPGFAAFAETGLVPHTDGSSVPEPPGLLLMGASTPLEKAGKRCSPTPPGSSGRLLTGIPTRCAHCARKRQRSSALTPAIPRQSAPRQRAAA
jgi:hypothetical protein